MPLHPRVKLELVRSLEGYEGRVPHFYLDSVGYVTVGVGHLIADRNGVASINMVRGGQAGAPASLDEKLDEYDRVSSQPIGFRAGWYGRVTRLVMPEAEIVRLRDAHIGRFHTELRAIYTRGRGYPDEFDRLPRPVQLALFDLIFNLGATRLVNVFRRFDAEVRAADWPRAAAESRRPQVSGSRNRYVFELFMAAARGATACVSGC